LFIEVPYYLRVRRRAERELFFIRPPTLFLCSSVVTYDVFKTTQSASPMTHFFHLSFQNNASEVGLNILARTKE
jgi:hypothetical protein